MHEQLREKFKDFWSQFEDIGGNKIKAYQTGYAVEVTSTGKIVEAKLPIITYDLIHTNWFAGNIFNASLWTKSKAHPANFKLSDHFVNQLSKLIHETYGYVLEGIGGYWWIRRADNFIQYMQDPDDQTITRTIVTMTITNFNHLK